METFEPGIQSAYITHQFKEGEQGMKCRSCPRVMTIAEWQDRRRCFCQSTNAVLAVARSSAPTRLQTSHNSLNHQNTRVNTPCYTSSSNSRSSFSGWIRAVIVALFLGGGWWAVRPYINNIIQENSLISSTQSTPSQLTPKEVITQYYQLATSNQTAALDLLSDEYKAWYNQNDGGNSAKSFWNTIQTVEIYAFLTLSQSDNKHQIKVWLKYLTVDGYTACESQIIEVVLSQTENKWLIDKTGNVEQKFNCEQ